MNDFLKEKIINLNNNNHPINKQELLKIIKEISLREAAIGGPYYDIEGKLDKDFNLLILRFLERQKISMPKLKRFLFHTKQNTKTSEEGIELLLTTELSGISKDAFKIIKEIIKKTANGNKDGQMSYLPRLFYNSLKTNKNKINDEFINKLCLMNSFFWSAFIIYDDFWDQDEKADPLLLPAANIMSRHFFLFFSSLFKENKEYYDFFIKLMDKLDSANIFEIQNCRLQLGAKFIPINFKNFDTKYFPCAGHILGPLAILMKMGLKIDSIETKATIDFFKNYLIARQLSDDMHDISEDLKQGHVSLAVNELLKDIKQKTNKNDYLIIFWTKTIDRLCNISNSLLKEAIKNLDEIKTMKDKSIFIKLCKDLEVSSSKAIKERDENLNLTKILSS